MEVPNGEDWGGDSVCCDRTLVWTRCDSGWLQHDWSVFSDDGSSFNDFDDVPSRCGDAVDPTRNGCQAVRDKWRRVNQTAVASNYPMSRGMARLRQSC